jgi:hypothetical protein
MRKILLLTIVLTTICGVAIAQSDGQRGTNFRQDGTVRVQASVNLFIPGPTGDGEDAAKIRDRARRVIYEMAGRECDLLREVLARECRLEGINTNLNRQNGQPTEGYAVNGSMSLQIILK